MQEQEVVAILNIEYCQGAFLRFFFLHNFVFRSQSLEELCFYDEILLP